MHIYPEIGATCEYLNTHLELDTTWEFIRVPCVHRTLWMPNDLLVFNQTNVTIPTAVVMDLGSLESDKKEVRVR